MADELLEALRAAGFLEMMEHGDQAIAECGHGPDYCLRIFGKLGIRITGEDDLDVALEQVALAMSASFETTAEFASQLASEHYGEQIKVALRVTKDGTVALGFVKPVHQAMADA